MHKFQAWINKKSLFEYKTEDLIIELYQSSAIKDKEKL
jgi:hypothetical protein